MQRSDNVPSRFVGTFTKAVDSKGRVSVPPPFRACFGADDDSGVYVLQPLRGENFIYAFTYARLVTLAPNAETPFDSEAESEAIAIFGGSEHLPIDRQGRISLTRALRSVAGITDEVCFIGAGSHFQIWEPGAGLRRMREAREAAGRRLGLQVRQADGREDAS